MEEETKKLYINFEVECRDQFYTKIDINSSFKNTE
jgi:hypothetical protein